MLSEMDCLSKNELDYLIINGLWLDSKWDDETECEYWYIGGLSDDEDEIIYFDHERLAYNDYLDNRGLVGWPSKEVMELLSLMHREFNRLNLSR